MLSKSILLLVFLYIAIVEPNSPEVSFATDEVKNGLISEGISESGASEIADFLFKDRLEDATAEELKTEFRELLGKLSRENKTSIKKIINNEVDKLFSDEIKDNDSIFLVG